MAATLVTTSCKEAAKTAADQQDAESAEVEESTTEAEEPETSAPDYDFTDVTAFGLKGCVKKAVIVRYEATPEGDKLVKGSRTYAYNDSLVTFNDQGQVTIDIYANPYSYDSDGEFVKGRSKDTKMDRDDKGRVIQYVNREGSNDWEGYSYEFDYDKKGRLSKIEWVGWEEISETVMHYEGDNVYPSREKIELQVCADIFKSDFRYRYTAFDNRGNWTEREIWCDELETTVAYEGNENPEVKTSKSYFIEQRTITYY